MSNDSPVQARSTGLAILARVEDAQHENVALVQLIAKLVVADDHAAHLAPAERRQPLPEPRMRR